MAEITPRIPGVRVGSASVDREAVRCRLFGSPLSQSLSPWVHDCFAKQRGITIDYELIETKPEELKNRLEVALKDGIRGINLTIPLKEEGYGCCVTKSPRAHACGAVNVLSATPDGWHGDNTDGSGFWRDLIDRHHFQNRDGRILVLGNGGAARGIVGHLIAASLDISLAVRNRDRGLRLAESIHQHGYPRIPVYDLVRLPEDRSFQLIINATSAGLSGVLPDLHPRMFASDPWVYDISYGPAARLFLSWAARQGAAHVIDGLGMLIEQAGEAFRLWTGCLCDTDPVYSILREQYPL